MCKPGYATFDAGFGGCSTYADKNKPHCTTDTSKAAVQGLSFAEAIAATSADTAAQICPECGRCQAKTIAPPASPTLATPPPATAEVPLPESCSKYPEDGSAGIYVGPEIHAEPIKGVIGHECAALCSRDNRCTYWLVHARHGCILKTYANKLKRQIQTSPWMTGHCTHAVVDGCRLEGKEGSGDGFKAARIRVDVPLWSVRNKGACSEMCKETEGCICRCMLLCICRRMLMCRCMLLCSTNHFIAWVWVVILADVDVLSPHVCHAPWCASNSLSTGPCGANFF